ncbi:unnamed protein product [Allacma fusca]|uniref:Uncharacterized protein n=1 Tax=Allacma fusca TaxID=39272 RepID=A0A8J2NKA3_9HEXA|nr:unnamed protein product [Allacma fusca]
MGTDHRRPELTEMKKEPLIYPYLGKGSQGFPFQTNSERSGQSTDNFPSVLSVKLILAYLQEPLFWNKKKEGE